jgi:Putative beta-barrel porin-2, OmpL-like. bbp2
MKKELNSIFLALISLSSLALADSQPESSAQDTKKMVQNNFLETQQKGIQLSGYVDSGYSYNFNSSSKSAVTGRFGSDEASRGDFNLYAVKLALEKAMTAENKAQAGFRTDVMIGEDAYYLANRYTSVNQGDNDSQNSNYLFLEQAYVSIRAPVGNGWDFKVGKFASILGYEVMERPANMNTTYGLLFDAMPLYYTGVLSSYKFDDYIDVKLGVVNGSNSDNNTTTSGGGDGCAVLAALNVTAPGGNANWSNNFQYSSNEDNNTFYGTRYSTTGVDTQNTNSANEGSGSGHALIYNSWGNWVPKFADNKLLFAFNALLATATTGVNPYQYDDISNRAYGYTTTWYGAGAYAKYQINDWFYLASRGEYLSGSNGAIFDEVDNQAGAPSRWEYTVTSGFNVIDNLLIRAEYRLDWGNQTTYSSGTPRVYSAPAHYAGAEIVYSF